MPESRLNVWPASTGHRSNITRPEGRTGREGAALEIRTCDGQGEKKSKRIEIIKLGTILSGISTVMSVKASRTY